MEDTIRSNEEGIGSVVARGLGNTLVNGLAVPFAVHAIPTGVRSVRESQSISEGNGRFELADVVPCTISVTLLLGELIGCGELARHYGFSGAAAFIPLGITNAISFLYEAGRGTYR